MLFNVQLDRLRRWDRDGLLFIGDAAHAMSPVGGIGINLAVADAVAAARVLAPALRRGGIVPRSVLRRVQRRRWWPTAMMQGLQRMAHKLVANTEHAQQEFDEPSRPTSHPSADASPERASRFPPPIRLLQRWPMLQGVPGWLVAIGPLPEHAPDWARRTSSGRSSMPAGRA